MVYAHAALARRGRAAPRLDRLEHRLGIAVVVDETGEEIPDTRVSLEDCKTLDDYRRTKDTLQAMCGENCLILDSVEDREND